jgi:hypothetical protein
MKELILAIMLVCVSGLAQTCDPCICNWWGGILSCYGPEVNTFPNLTSQAKESISHIDILNTSLTNMPDIETFPNLFSMDVRDNKQLNCFEVRPFKNTSITLTTDCDDNDEATNLCIQTVINILSNYII